MGCESELKYRRGNSFYLLWLGILMLAIGMGCSSSTPNVRIPDMQIANTTLAKDVTTSGNADVPVNTTSVFSADDERIISYVAYHNLTGKHEFRWKWVDPSGNLYLDTNGYKVSAPSGKMVRDGSVWHQISVAGEKAMTMPGDWRAEIYMDDQLIARQDFVVTASAKSASMPPMLTIKDISFSKNLLEGGESANLNVTIENTGFGDAEDVFLFVESDTPEIKTNAKQLVGKISKNGGKITVTIPVTAGFDLKTGTAALDIQVVEPRHKVTIKGKRVSIPTRKFKHPDLILAQFAAVEGQSSASNNQIDLFEVVDLKIAVQNVGQGKAEDISVYVTSDQKGVVFLGQGEGSAIKTTKNIAGIPGLDSGKYKVLNYRYYVNSDFTGKELAFKIAASEKMDKYGFSEVKTVPINTALRAEGHIRQVETQRVAMADNLVIEDIPDFTVDVDVHIPKSAINRPDAVAVVIGNRNYMHKDIPVVKYAHQDARVVKSYLVNTLGLKDGNIFFETDITKARFESLFGNAEDPNGLLSHYVKPDRSEVFVYYSGHGAPDPRTQKGYFIPVDCDPATVKLNGYALDIFYKNLAKIKAKNTVVVLDACFSGGTSTGQMLIANASPVLIKVQSPVTENTVVLASSKNDQISSWYNEKQHGLFTYFFLKGLSGHADKNKDDAVTLAEVYDFVSDRSGGVPYWARRLHGGRLQEPVLMGGNPDVVLVKY